MENIQNILQTAPTSILTRFKNLFKVMDHPIYHPEGSVGMHITIVLNRAMTLNDIDMVLVAILHDICKAENGKIKKIPPNKFPKLLPQGGEYWQNIYHAEDACNLIAQDKEMQDWINLHKGNYDRIFTLVQQHMRIKNYVKGKNKESNGMKPSTLKQYEEEHAAYLQDILTFFGCDTMSNTEYEAVDKDIQPLYQIVKKVLGLKG